MKMRAIELFKCLAAVVLFAPALAMATVLASALATTAGVSVKLDRAPVSNEPQVLQRGAKLFATYCLNCHGASAVRYSHLQKIGFDEETIANELIFSSEKKIGDLMGVTMTRDDGEAWFGIAPPDLSLIARALASSAGSGADYLYTYMRGFYRDEERPVGWNNKVFANVGMPHAMWDMQESMPQGEYDKAVADLVSFMVWMAEPAAATRKTIGVFVLIFLIGFSVLAHMLGKTYWKDAKNNHQLRT